MTKCIEYYAFPPNSTSRESPIKSQIFMATKDEVDNDLSISSDYRFESARLNSFKKWPCPWIKPEVLAAAGFYYTGVSDRVECFECHEQIYHWKAIDDPMADHRRWSGRCRFVRGIPCGNVPIGTDPSTIPAHGAEGVDVCGPYGLPCMPCSGSNNEVQETEERMNYKLLNKYGPRHSEYTTYSARLASYDKWPKAMAQTKEELATAGFYYSGSGDETLCYYCGGGLKDWEPNDDPWVEHAKWFDKCPYLILTKGTEFVRNITKETENIPINKLDKKADSESIVSGSSQNSTISEETNFNNTEASASKSSEISSAEQSIQTQDDKSREKDSRLCKICFSREIRIAFIPCGHLLACAECAKNMKICGVCRKNIELTVQVYIS